MLIPPEKAKKIIDAAGGAVTVAEKFTISRNSVYEWIRKGRLPSDRCPEIEVMTDGAFKCEDMRPDVQWHVLRQKAA